MRLRSFALVFLLAIATLSFLTLLFKNISYPLLWHDESDTVMFGQRVVEYGYPKVHGPKNVVYGLDPGPTIAIHEPTDAYTGAPWGYYYFATIGVALAQQVDDIYLKTALVRLPFAVIGALGMLLLLLAVLDSIDGPGHRRWFAILYWLFAAYSISLILHLREARYYGLVVFISSALVFVFVRHHVYGRLGYGAYVALTTALLFLLFNTFYPVYAVFLVALGLHHAGLATFGSGPGSERLAALLRNCVPLVLSLLTTLPLLLVFEFLTQVGSWMDTPDRSYSGNLLGIVAKLARLEFLLPALAMRIAVLVQLQQYPPEHVSSGSLRRRQIAGFLFLFTISHLVVLARSHSIWLRYFIALGPIITTLFLLDAFTLWGLVRHSGGSARRLGTVMGTVVAVSLAATCWMRVPEFRGRIHEITHRYMGPLDFVIPYLKEKYPQPQELVIATNYEEPVLMYYLGSRVIVGYYGANLEKERDLQPDVIIPRSWKSNRSTLEEMARRAPYESTSFPVRSLPTNGFPELSSLFQSRVFHYFRTQLAAEGEPRLVILERAPSPRPD